MGEMNDGLAGRTIAITGGASGIGRATAVLCAESGARVALVDINPATAEASAAAISAQTGAVVRHYICDVSKEDQVERAFEKINEELGTPQGLFASAGVDLDGFAHELPTERWHLVIETNLSGIFYASRAVLRKLVEKGLGGSLVLCSSPASFVAFAAGGASAYASSKGGISSLMRTLAVDYASRGIRVNALIPGATETPLMWMHIAPEDQPRMRALVESEVPIGRIADAAEPGRAVHWLLGDLSSYVTGSHLVCDGGILAKGSVSF
jgi:NAD(P)-dependent dehydrogenase (short-subunit alcohol dehydrogenase family)